MINDRNYDDWIKEGIEIGCDPIFHANYMSDYNFSDNNRKLRVFKRQKNLSMLSINELKKLKKELEMFKVEVIKELIVRV